ncbi:type IV secretory system conjugative DNA transfer family protein [Alkalibacillus aidingensis]|uniref:type IV secretory system conjugative DNA transfer family protein n=1 Tax=Alkalibacillus aidingensis TaxID=2747607 RepID=UPI0016610FEE|nr:type IV secretory system conjugative DNA transfer family protein [Alkalibacillus aidingensis]
MSEVFKEDEVQKFIRSIIILISAMFSGLIVYLIFGNPKDILVDALVGLFERDLKPLLPIVVFIVLSGIFTVLFISLKKKYINSGDKDKRLKKHGTAEQLSPKEAKKQSPELFGDDGIVVSKNVRLNKKTSFTNSLIIGPPGSGKSSNTYVPNLLKMDESFSAIVTDPSGDIAKDTAVSLRNRGYNILIWNPDKKDTMGYNLLKNCEDTDEVYNLSETILFNSSSQAADKLGGGVSGAEWINMAVPAFAAVMIYEWEFGEKNISNVIRAFETSDYETIGELVKQSSRGEVLWKKFEKSMKSEGQLAGIEGTLDSCIKAFSTEKITRLVSRDDIHPNMLREKPTVLFLQFPEDEAAYYAPLISPIFGQVFNKLKKNREGQNVFAFIDEFANIGKIPNMGSYSATLRKFNVSLVLAVQSLSQLNKVYSKDERGELYDCLSTKVILPGLSNTETLNELQSLLGTTEINTKTTSVSDRSQSTSEGSTRRNLFSSDEIRRIEDLHMLFVTGNLNPVYDRQNRFYEDEEMKEMTAIPFDSDKYLSEYRENNKVVDSEEPVPSEEEMKMEEFQTLKKEVEDALEIKVEDEINLFSYLENNLSYKVDELKDKWFIFNVTAEDLDSDGEIYMKDASKPKSRHLIGEVQTIDEFKNLSKGDSISIVGQFVDVKKQKIQLNNIRNVTNL